MNTIDRNSHTPLHLQLAAILREQISSGQIQPGDKLCSETQMVRKYGIARLTVREALNHLVTEGLIEKQHGRGSFCKVSSTQKNINVLLDMSAPYFTPYYMQSIYEVLAANHANLIAADTKNSHAEILRLLNAIAHRGSDGVILQGCPQPDFDQAAFTDAISLLKANRIPVIVLDYGYGMDSLCCAIMDEAEAGRIAARHLQEFGHRHVFAICYAGDGLSEERFRGFRECYPDTGRIDVCDTLPQTLITAVANGTTAFFCFNDPLAQKCIDILMQHGITVPDQVSVIGVDDSEIAKFTCMTSIAHPKQQLGKYVAKEILSHSAPRTKVFTPTLISRNSVKSLSKKE